MNGGLSFAAREWLPWVVAGGALAILLLAWSYRRAPAGGVRLAGFLLKLVGLAALAFCLLEPQWTGQRVRPGANVLALLADNSAGMDIRDPGAERTRGEQLRAVVDPSLPGWQADLAEDFEVRRYLFDTRLQRTPAFGELDFAGRATALGTALAAVGDRTRGRPVAGILLFTDGNATDLPSGVATLGDLPPVYPVVFGSDSPASDVAVGSVSVTQAGFEDAPVTVQAGVVATGLDGRTVAVRLRDVTGRVVGEERVEVGGDGTAPSVRFQVKPDRVGVLFYRLETGLDSEWRDGVAPTNSVEATLANNSEVVVVNRGRGPYRILYVAGRPNWEYKFLNRALMSDEQLQLVGLLRIARREPKFDFRGRAGETSNPLFRGFGDQDRAEVERYDQPVLVRLNTRDAQELQSGFPRTAAELFAYHAVILDDLESSFFGPDQAALLNRFVSERGGGLMMLGGMESFQQGEYHRTPVGDLLPVYLDRAPEPTGAPVRLDLAREGWLQAWARLRDTEPAERLRIGAMPAFEVVNPVRDVKPGASVIATVTDAAGRSLPALVVQRYGRGRSAALTVGDLWRWGMRGEENRTDLDRAWRQLARWLVTETPERVELAVEPVPADPNGAVRLEVRARTPEHLPLDDASVTVAVTPVAFGSGGVVTNELRLTAEPAPGEPGLYLATYVPRMAGGFLATAHVTNAVGAEVGRAEAGWSSDLAAAEFRSLRPNRDLLAELARRTGGEVVEAGDLPALVRRLPQKAAPEMENWSRPVWHTPFLFALALACLVAEWGLRRSRGLP